MKNLFSTLSFFLLLLNFATAQIASKGFNFQGYARNSDGSAMSGQTITAQFTIYPKGGSTEYQEQQTVTTDAYGVFQAVIGSSTNPIVGLFQNIQFSQKNYMLRVEVKSGTGSFVTINDTELLSVPYAKQADNGVPPGTILPFAGPKSKIPVGYLACDGASITASAYPNLFAAIGNSWGGSGATFNVPDLRGYFLRGVSDGTGSDPDRTSRTAQNTGGNTGDNVGTVQGDAHRSHNHGGTTGNAGAHNHTNGNYNRILQFNGVNTVSAVDNNAGSSEAELTSSAPLVAAPDHTHTISSDGGNENRPKNASVFYIIKY
jgi:microcystin-dependent protein